MHGCTGRCVVGIVIAIIVGAFFIWTLIEGISMQVFKGATMSTVFWYYLGAIILAVVAKMAKMHAMHCGCDAKAPKTKPIPNKRKR